MGNNTLRLRTRRRLQLQQPWYASDHSNPFANPHGPYVWTLSLHCWPTWRTMLWSWSSEYMHRPKETQCCVKPSNPKHQECVYELQDHLGVSGGHSTWKNPGNKYGQNMTRINISKANHSKDSNFNNSIISTGPVLSRLCAILEVPAGSPNKSTQNKEQIAYLGHVAWSMLAVTSYIFLYSKTTTDHHEVPIPWRGLFERHFWSFQGASRASERIWFISGCKHLPTTYTAVNSQGT